MRQYTLSRCSVIRICSTVFSFGNTKSLGHLYSWGNSISKTKIKKDMVTLPSINDAPDYAFMENLISAVQKLVIKDVVRFSDEKIRATRRVVKQNDKRRNDVINFADYTISDKDYQLSRVAEKDYKRHENKE